METDALERILTGLYERTNLNQIFWSSTSSQNEFKTKLGKSSITIDHWNSDGVNRSDLAVYNSDGTLIERLVFLEDNQYYIRILRLHELILKRILKIDETYADIFNALG